MPDILNVKVIPNAKREQIKREAAADGSMIYKVYVTAVPESGKANKAVIKLLSKELGVAKSSLSITNALSSRVKTIKINL